MSPCLRVSVSRSRRRHGQIRNRGGDPLVPRLDPHVGDIVHHRILAAAVGLLADEPGSLTSSSRPGSAPGLRVAPVTQWGQRRIANKSWGIIDRPHWKLEAGSAFSGPAFCCEYIILLDQAPIRPGANAAMSAGDRSAALGPSASWNQSVPASVNAPSSSKRSRPTTCPNPSPMLYSPFGSAQLAHILHACIPAGRAFDERHPERDRRNPSAHAGGRPNGKGE